MSTEDIVTTRLWPAHKLKFNVMFEDVEEEWRRVRNFTANHIFIDHFNSYKNNHHYCGHNKLSHWSYEEYLSWLTVKNVQPQKMLELESSDDSNAKPTEKADIPDEVDWKARGKVTVVQDQDRCGSCWAFSAVGAIESARAIKTGELINLSEQQLIDCDIVDKACAGGYPSGAFKYVMIRGLMRWRDYPYRGYLDFCRYRPGDLFKISGYQVVPPNEQSLMEACANVGPISIIINASAKSFQFYKSGIYYDPLVPPTPLDHAVLLVGYGHINKDNFWFVKNSWGTDWGEYGYIKIMRNGQNYLGVDSIATYPTL